MGNSDVEKQYSDLDRYIYGEFEFWCMVHNVEPKTESQRRILERAMHEKFEGRKLSKALYKVRHPKKYAEEKRRWKKARKAKIEKSGGVTR